MKLRRSFCLFEIFLAFESFVFAFDVADEAVEIFFCTRVDVGRVCCSPCDCCSSEEMVKSQRNLFVVRNTVSDKVGLCHEVPHQVFECQRYESLVSPALALEFAETHGQHSAGDSLVKLFVLSEKHGVERFYRVNALVVLHDGV